MHRRYSLVLAVALAGLTSASVALAGPKPFGGVEPLQGEPAQRIHMLGSEGAQATCTIGVTGAPAFFFNYLLPPNDSYYTRISSTDCTACAGASGIEVLTANILLNYRAACSFPVRVAIVAATGPAGCRTPDPTTLLSAPLTYNLAPTAPGNYTFSMPLPVGTCIIGDAFIEITFLNNVTGCNSSTTIPRLITTASCTPCRQYNIYPGGNDEWCSVTPPGDIVVNADVNCCYIVPTLPKSWGQLRIMYGS